MAGLPYEFYEDQDGALFRIDRANVSVPAAWDDVPWSAVVESPRSPSGWLNARGVVVNSHGEPYEPGSFIIGADGALYRSDAEGQWSRATWADVPEGTVFEDNSDTSVTGYANGRPPEGE